MRTIKFRGKRISGGKWIYGDLLTDPEPHGEGKLSIMYWNDEIGWMKDYVIPKTVGQYTGMKDPQGVEIYEGDIVFVTQLGFAEVKYESGAFFMYSHQSNACIRLYDQNCVNGNIFENPELLTAEPWKH